MDEFANADLCLVFFIVVVKVAFWRFNKQMNE
jgi:hypothetical protein